MLRYKVLDTNYKNIKELLLVYFQISNRLLIKLKKENRIFLNGKREYVTKELNINDIVEIDIDFNETSRNIVPIKMNLSIIYEDESMLIANKPSGIPVHPSILHFEDSLSNGVNYYFQSRNLKRKIRPVNRLDKDTSGIVIFAKNEYIQEYLIREMKNQIFSKEYLAILDGHLEKNTGTIVAPISRKEGSIIEREVSENGETSITHYEVIKKYEFNNIPFSLVKFKLETGRTHQIRLHSKYIGHPIIGDFLYGSKSSIINRQALHAFKINLIHPVTREKLCFEIPLPEDMKSII